MEKIVYKMTCRTTGKSYIGETVELRRRLQEHKSRAKRRHSKVAEAITIYGMDDFDVEILDNSHNEKYYIELYDTYNNGLNSTIDGQTGSGQGAVLFKTKNNKAMLWWVHSPCGAEFWVFNLGKLCDKHGLVKTSMYKTAYGMQYSHQGWRAEAIRYE